MGGVGAPIVSGLPGRGVGRDDDNDVGTTSVAVPVRGRRRVLRRVVVSVVMEGDATTTSIELYILASGRHLLHEYTCRRTLHRRPFSRREIGSEMSHYHRRSFKVIINNRTDFTRRYYLYTEGRPVSVRRY